MIVGCPKEIKVREYRVGLVPASARELVAHGHSVLIEKDGGLGAGISNKDYSAVGATIVESADEIWQQSDMVVKVKEPIEPEYVLMKPGQILFTFLHLAAEAKLTHALLANDVSAIAYETIEINGTLPLLKPMSEVAGRLAIQVGAWCLEKPQGGKGILLGGVPGVRRGNVTIIGGGVVGCNAAKIALGMGADVTLLDTNLDRLEYLDHIFAGRIKTLYSNSHNVAENIVNADLVVGAVLIVGARAPKLVTKKDISKMAHGSVIVDVAVDQGGCVETMHPTTHDTPTFEVDGVLHYGVSNMPGAVAHTSTFALAHATHPFMLELANQGAKKACQKNSALALGLNTHKGHITYEAVARAHSMPFKSLDNLI